MAESWTGKDPRDMTAAERKGWHGALSKAVAGLRRVTGRDSVVEVVTMTTYPETAWKTRGKVRRGQYVACPAASDGSFPAGSYPVIGVGSPSNGYSGNLRWCYPVTSGSGAAEQPHMSGVDPDAFQRD